MMKKDVGESSIKANSISKVKMPEPSTFNSLRDAKELESFLWDIEKYFKVAKAMEEA